MLYSTINNKVLRFILAMRLQISQFFCFDLATGLYWFMLLFLIAHMYVDSLVSGAKVIGSLGVLKHSLAILVIYLDCIDLWVLSNDKESHHIPGIVFTCKFINRFLFLHFSRETFESFSGRHPFTSWRCHQRHQYCPVVSPLQDPGDCE